MKHYNHFIRLLALFVLIIIAYQVAKKIIVPKSYGKIGRYRADAVDEEKAKPIRHAGHESCKPCHPDKTAMLKSSKHKTIGCESCHGDSYDHTQNPSGVKPLRPSADTMRAFCTKCHAANPTRPKWFRQIDPKQHNPALACNICHQPHKPEQP